MKNTGNGIEKRVLGKKFQNRTSPDEYIVIFQFKVPKKHIFQLFYKRKPFFSPCGVFFEQLNYKQICSQCRKLKFLGSEDLFQKSNKLCCKTFFF
jgi:hypothetical protein